MDSPHVLQRPAIRWLVRRDHADILHFDRQAFGLDAWDDEQLCTHLRKRNCIGMVAEVGDTLTGYMVYDLHSSHVNLIRLAVGQEFRRNGVGTAMVRRLVDKLSSHRRKRLVANVSEYELGAQLFFRACGLRAVKVNRGAADDGADLYRMEYSL